MHDHETNGSERHSLLHYAAALRLPAGPPREQPRATCSGTHNDKIVVRRTRRPLDLLLRRRSRPRHHHRLVSAAAARPLGRFASSGWLGTPRPMPEALELLDGAACGTAFAEVLGARWLNERVPCREVPARRPLRCGHLALDARGRALRSATAGVLAGLVKPRLHGVRGGTKAPGEPPEATACLSERDRCAATTSSTPSSEDHALPQHGAASGAQIEPSIGPSPAGSATRRLLRWTRCGGPRARGPDPGACARAWSRLSARRARARQGLERGPPAR